MRESEIPAETEFLWEGTNDQENDAPRLVFDFGDLGCGDLVLELRQKLREVAAGTKVRVLATDPGAAEDIPAWVRMVGHDLLNARPPVFDLKKRREP